MKIRILLLALVFATSFFGTIAVKKHILIQTHKPETVQTERNPAIVRLYDIGEARFFCSGTVVSDNIVVTAAHCLGDHASGIEVRNQWGKPVGSWVMGSRYEGRSDQGLLIGDFSMFDKMPIVTAPADVMIILKRNSLRACGFPYSGPLYCSTLDYKGLYGFQFAAEGSAWPGMSGGPVIDMETGFLVGVITAMAGDEMLLSPTVNIFYNLGLDEVK